MIAVDDEGGRHGRPCQRARGATHAGRKLTPLSSKARLMENFTVLRLSTSLKYIADPVLLLQSSRLGEVVSPLSKPAEFTCV